MCKITFGHTHYPGWTNLKGGAPLLDRLNIECPACLKKKNLLLILQNVQREVKDLSAMNHILYLHLFEEEYPNKCLGVVLGKSFCST